MQSLLDASAEGSVKPFEKEFQSTVQRIIVAASSALLFYDYFLTLSREVAWVWQAPKRCSWMTTVFYINRYLLLFGHPVIMFRTFLSSLDPARPEDPDRLQMCISLGVFRQYFSIVVQVVVSVFMILRTYALYNFDRRVLTFFILCAMATTGIAISSVMMIERTSYHPNDLTLHGCILQVPDSSAHRVAGAWIGLLAFDVVTFLFTLWKSLKEPWLGGSSIMRVLLRDGVIYFGIMTGLTCGTVASYFSENPYRRGITTPLANVVSSCLASRLILNLRDPSLSSRFAPGSVQGTRDVLSTVRWEGQGEDRGVARSGKRTLDDSERAEDRRHLDKSKAASEEGLLRFKDRDILDKA